MKKEKNIRIVFGATQKADDDKAEIEQILDGVRIDENGVATLIFEEEWEGVDEPVLSTMMVKPDSVIVKREGPVRTEMEFLRNSDTMCEYETMMGSLSFVITTLELKTDIDEDYLWLYARYEMYAQGSLISENELKIEATDV